MLNFQFFVIVGVILLLEIVAGSLILVNAEKASNLLSQSLVSFRPKFATLAFGPKALMRKI